jgi:hypothetical protein
MNTQDKPIRAPSVPEPILHGTSIGLAEGPELKGSACVYVQPTTSTNTFSAQRVCIPVRELRISRGPLTLNALQNIGLQRKPALRRVPLQSDDCSRTCFPACQSQHSPFAKAPFPNITKADCRIEQDIVIAGHGEPGVSVIVEEYLPSYWGTKWNDFDHEKNEGNITQRGAEQNY